MKLVADLLFLQKILDHHSQGMAVFPPCAVVENEQLVRILEKMLKKSQVAFAEAASVLHNGTGSFVPLADVEISAVNQAPAIPAVLPGIEALFLKLFLKKIQVCGPNDLIGEELPLIVKAFSFSRAVPYRRRE